ncbi:MAG: transposase [Chloroflexi bacterium]|nr:transposase [Chloroflexota bacterium]
MPEYRRAYLEGGTYFFTVVSYNRRPILKDHAAIDLLWQCFRKASATHLFDLNAIVVLPDHLHAIWPLPDGDSDFSIRWQQIKSAFSLRYRSLPSGGVSGSMRKKGEKVGWQGPGGGFRCATPTLLRFTRAHYSTARAAAITAAASTGTRRLSSTGRGRNSNSAAARAPSASRGTPSPRCEGNRRPPDTRAAAT